MTTTDEVTHLRALLAEQTARAERAEALVERAEVAFHAAIARANQALAANAEMRAALEEWHDPGHAMHPATCRTCTLLSRPDLGASMVVVPREVMERWAADVDQRHVITAEMRALLGKAGG